MRKIGLMALDPGTTTGIAYGILKVGERHKSTVKEVFDRCGPVDFATAEVRKATTLESAVEIAKLWVEMEKHMFKGVIPSHLRFIAIEDFILRAGPHSSAREGLDPVRITCHLEALLIDRNIKWFSQSASDAKSSFPNQRLRTNGLWVVGSEHKRDAMRHAALFVKRFLA